MTKNPKSTRLPFVQKLVLSIVAVPILVLFPPFMALMIVGIFYPTEPFVMVDDAVKSLSWNFLYGSVFLALAWEIYDILTKR